MGRLDKSRALCLRLVAKQAKDSDQWPPTEPSHREPNASLCQTRPVIRGPDIKPAWRGSSACIANDVGAWPAKLGPTVPNVVQGSQAIPGGGAYSKLDNSDDTLPGRDIDPQLCHLRPADSSGQPTREPLLRDAGRSVLSGAAYHGPGVDTRIGLRYSEAETALHGLCVRTGSRLVPGLASTD